MVLYNIEHKKSTYNKYLICNVKNASCVLILIENVYN